MVSSVISILPAVDGLSSLPVVTCLHSPLSFYNRIVAQSYRHEEEQTSFSRTNLSRCVLNMRLSLVMVRNDDDSSTSP